MIINQNNYFIYEVSGEITCFIVLVRSMICCEEFGGYGCS
jgi:hypothetical protein